MPMNHIHERLTGLVNLQDPFVRRLCCPQGVTMLFQHPPLLPSGLLSLTLFTVTVSFVVLTAIGEAGFQAWGTCRVMFAWWSLPATFAK